jgi:hypothetical protein
VQSVLQNNEISENSNGSKVQTNKEHSDNVFTDNYSKILTLPFSVLVSVFTRGKPNARSQSAHDLIPTKYSKFKISILKKVNRKKNMVKKCSNLVTNSSINLTHVMCQGRG